MHRGSNVCQEPHGAAVLHASSSCRSSLFKSAKESKVEMIMVILAMFIPLSMKSTLEKVFLPMRNGYSQQ